MSDVSDLVVAYRYATKSPDPSTQNGAVLRTRAGRLYKTTAACNDFPKGLSIVAERLQRPLKYSFIEHAERNAIYAAARLGLWADGLEMVATWAACADCARAIVQAGIVRLIRHNPPIDGAVARWFASIDVGDVILREGGVAIVDVLDRLPDAPPVLRDGTLWQP
jgi:dCMP deaminase